MGDHRGCKRRHERHLLDGSVDGRVDFPFPGPDSPRVSMRVGDLSGAGLSFFLGHELPGLDVGDCLSDARLVVGDRTARGDLLVMHMTPDQSTGSRCGALFYPRGDADLLALREILADLEARAVHPAASRV